MDYKKLQESGIQWAEYIESLHHLFEGNFIYKDEYTTIRKRLIDKFCKDDIDANNPT